MRKDPNYSIYYINPATLLVTGIIPLILLIYWNCIIYQQIKSSSKWLAKNSSYSVRRSHNLTTCQELDRNQKRKQPEEKFKGSKGQRQEKEFAKVMIGIVVSFVATHALRAVLNFHEAIAAKDTLICIEQGKQGVPFWVLITSEFSKLVLVMNSSINSVIYCCMNSSFRKALFKKNGGNDECSETLTMRQNFRQTMRRETQPSLF